MNGHASTSNERERCLSDSENTRDLYHNGELRDDGQTSKSCFLSCNSEESMEATPRDSKHDTFAQASFIKMYYPPNIPFKQSRISHSDSIEMIPKSILERSNRVDVLPQAEPVPFNNPVIEPTESHTIESTPSKPVLNEATSFPTLPQPISHPEPPNVPTNIPSVKSSSIKRTQRVESYTSDDSNLSLYDDSFTQYMASVPNFVPIAPIANPPTRALNNSLDCGFDNSAYTYPSTSYPVYRPEFGLSEIAVNPTQPYFMSCPNYDLVSTPFSNPSKIYKKTNVVFENPTVVRPKFGKNIESSTSTANYTMEEQELFLNGEDLSSFKTPTMNGRTDSTVDQAKDQHGSRLIQHRIENSTPEDLNLMVNELVEDVNTLVVLVGDVFGNYVIQKLFDFGHKGHGYTIISKLRTHILELAVQMYGCRVIQKAIECGGEQVQNLIISELKTHVLDCIKDQNGNHVIQKCIERIASQNLEFMVLEICEHVVELSTHSYGCRVIQRILEHFNYDQKYRITSELYLHVPNLVLDQYGNYVVQHILDYCDNSPHRQYVFEFIRQNLFHLSSHKFASNVVEKSLVSGDPEERKTLMMEIFHHSTGSEDDMIYKMMKDPFANYVIQKMIDVIIKEKQHELFQLLVNKIKPHYVNLRRITYGKHIINKIDKINSKLSRSTFCKADTFDQPTSIPMKPINVDPRISQSQDYGQLNSLKSQTHVICDNLSEFPSLVSGNKMSVSSD